MRNKKYLIISTLILLSSYTWAIPHWETIIFENDEWHYFEANKEPENSWYQKDFNDQLWPKANGGFGYGDNDDNTTISTVNSLYLRTEFIIAQAEDIELLALYIDYDDGFVAYINGEEIARSSNVSGDIPAYNAGTSIDREATMYTGEKPEQYIIDKKHIKTGKNILAIHILNNNAASSDLSARPYLHANILSDNTIYHPTPNWFTEPAAIQGFNLPILKINTYNQTIVDDPKISAYLGIINNKEGQLNLLTDSFSGYNGHIAIEYRGQSSLGMFPKKSYGFETRDDHGENRNTQLLGLPKENDWILYAPYSDKSLMRNTLTFEMAKALDTYSSRTKYCQLYVNNQYEGIYVLMEKIKRDNNRIDIDSLIEIDNDVNSLTGGYIFKVDKMDNDYSDGRDGFTPNLHPSYPNAMGLTFQYVYPKVKNLKNTQRNYLRNYVTKAEETLISSDFSNKETGYNQYLNIGSFVDFLLINEVSKEVDKYRYSSYFYKKKASRGNEIYAGPIWDFNLGYGNVDYWDYGLSTSGWIYTDAYRTIFWWKRLMEDPYFYRLTCDRYRELRADKWSDYKINSLIDSMELNIDKGQKLNFERWPILGSYVWPNKYWQNMDFYAEVEQLRIWVLARLKWMDKQLQGSPLAPEVTLALADEVHIDLQLKDVYFNHAMLKRKHFSIKGDNGYFDIDTVLYNSASNARIKLQKKQNTSFNNTIYVKVDDNTITAFRDLKSNEISISTTIKEHLTSDIKLSMNDHCITICNTNSIPTKTNIEIYDIQGKKLVEYNATVIGKHQIERRFRKGIYVLQYNTPTARYTQKIIIP